MGYGQAVGIVPGDAVEYAIKKLLNGTAQDMAVNASSGSPQYFSWSPENNTDIWYVSGIHFFLWDSAVTNPGNFGGISALTNGIVLQAQSKGNAFDISTCKDNMDIVLAYRENSQAVGTSGFLENSDIYLGELKLDVPIPLYGTSDYIRMKIQDNISALDELRAVAQVWRPIS